MTWKAKKKRPFKRRSFLLKHKRRLAKVKVGSDSGLEVTFKELLDTLKVKYEQQHKISYYFYDFYIPEIKLLIEVDGDYWHCNPEKYPNGPINKMQYKQTLKDRHKNYLAKENGYTLLRIWEKEINTDIRGVKKLLKETIKKGS